MDVVTVRRITVPVQKGERTSRVSPREGVVVSHHLPHPLCLSLHLTLGEDFIVTRQLLRWVRMKVFRLGIRRVSSPEYFLEPFRIFCFHCVGRKKT